MSGPTKLKIMNAFYILLIGCLGALMVIGIINAFRSRKTKRQNNKITYHFRDMKTNKDYEYSERPTVTDYLN